MPVPIKPPRGQFNQLPDVRMVQHNPDMYGAAEGRGLQQLGKGIGSLADGIMPWAAVIADKERKKKASETLLMKQDLQKDFDSAMNTGDRFSDEYADFAPYGKRIGDAARGAAADFDRFFAEHSERRFAEKNFTEEQLQELRDYAGELRKVGHSRLQAHEANQIDAATNQNLQAASESIVQQMEEKPFDSDFRELQLSELSEVLIASANMQGLSGDAHFLYYKNGMGNAESRIATAMLNSVNAIPVSLTPDQYDERFEGDLETVERFIHDEKNALSPTQKQKLNDTVEQARRVREERRHAAVNKATTEAKAASLNYRLGKAPYDEAARMAETLPPYQRAALETELDNHRRVLLAAEDDDRFEMMQNRLRVLAKTSRTPPQQAGQADSPAKPTGEQAGGVGWINQIQAEQNTIKAFATEPEDPRGAYLKWQKTLPNDQRRRSEKRLADYDAGVLKAKEAAFKEARRAWKSQFDQTMVLGGMRDETGEYMPLSIETRLSMATDAALKHLITPTEHEGIREKLIKAAESDNEKLMRQCAERISKDYYTVLDIKGGAAMLKKDVDPNKKLTEYTVKKNPYREGMTTAEKHKQYETALEAKGPVKGFFARMADSAAGGTAYGNYHNETAEETQRLEMSNQMAADLLNEVAAYNMLSIQEKKTVYGEKPPTPMEFFESIYEPKKREMIQRSMVERMSKRRDDAAKLQHLVREKTFQAPAFIFEEKE